MAVLEPEELAHLVSELQDPRIRPEKRKVLLSILTNEPRHHPGDDMPTTPSSVTPATPISAPANVSTFSPAMDNGTKGPVRM